MPLITLKGRLRSGRDWGNISSTRKLTQEQRKNYFCLDIRANMVEVIHQTFPDVQAIVHDCQQPLTIVQGWLF